jgi:hypothetical protein
MTEEERFEEIDIDASPFEIQPIEGIPFARDSEEARAIERVLRRASEARRGLES